MRVTAIFASLVCALALDASAWAQLAVSGELRVRYESLDGQFRQSFDGSDQALLTRALIAAEFQRGAWSVVGEIQDSRAFLDDKGTPLSGGFVNASDLLQGYIGYRGGGFLGAGSSGLTKVGRQTVSISSKRQLERVSYANVIRAFTGITHLSTNDRGDELHLVAVVPVERSPGDRASAAENEFEADREEWHRQVFGIHYRRRNSQLLGISDLWAEGFVYSLFEQDGGDFEGRNRRVVYPGFRLFRPKAAGRWDIDLEPSFRIGKSRASSRPDDTEDLDVLATRVIAILGYTFDRPWRPRIAAEWFWASGDGDPDDSRDGRYDRLFGSRRTDLNNTSLHGPLTYANLNAPGFRLEVKPNDVTDARLIYSAAHQASATDSFVIARLRDPSGQSGTFVGHAIDTRARYLPKDSRMVYEIGASALLFGGYTEEVPGGPAGDRTLFGYVQATYSF